MRFSFLIYGVGVVLDNISVKLLYGLKILSFSRFFIYKIILQWLGIGYIIYNDFIPSRKLVIDGLHTSIESQAYFLSFMSTAKLPS